MGDPEALSLYMSGLLINKLFFLDLQHEETFKVFCSLNFVLWYMPNKNYQNAQQVNKAFFWMYILQAQKLQTFWFLIFAIAKQTGAPGNVTRTTAQLEETSKPFSVLKRLYPHMTFLCSAPVIYTGE